MFPNDSVDFCYVKSSTTTDFCEGYDIRCNSSLACNDFYSLDSTELIFFNLLFSEIWMSDFMSGISRLDGCDDMCDEPCALLCSYLFDF